MSGRGVETTVQLWAGVVCSLVTRGLGWNSTVFENCSQALAFFHNRHICLNFDFSFMGS